MPTPLSTILHTPLILRPLTDAEQDKWPVNPPTFALCPHSPWSGVPDSPVAFLHDDVLFDPDGNYFEA